MGQVDTAGIYNIKGGLVLTNKGLAARQTSDCERYWQAFTALIKTKYVALVAHIGLHTREQLVVDENIKQEGVSV